MDRVVFVVHLLRAAAFISAAAAFTTWLFWGEMVTVSFEVEDVEQFRVGSPLVMRWAMISMVVCGALSLVLEESRMDRRRPD